MWRYQSDDTGKEAFLKAIRPPSSGACEEEVHEQQGVGIWPISGSRDRNATGGYIKSGFGAGQGFRNFPLYCLQNRTRRGRPFPAAAVNFLKMSERCNISPLIFVNEIFGRCNISRTFGFYNTTYQQAESLERSFEYERFTDD